MLYAILCYNSGRRRRRLDQGGGRRRHGASSRVVQDEARGEGPARPGGAAAADHRRDDPAQGRATPLVIDGPFAETKEQLLGFYVVECDDLEEALEIARDLGRGQRPAAPTRSGRSACFQPGERRAVMTDLAWIEAALDRRRGPRRSARCCAISATSTPPRRPSRRPACGR